MDIKNLADSIDKPTISKNIQNLELSKAKITYASRPKEVIW